MGAGVSHDAQASTRASSTSTTDHHERPPVQGPGPMPSAADRTDTATPLVSSTAAAHVLLSQPFDYVPPHNIQPPPMAVQVPVQANGVVRNVVRIHKHTLQFVQSPQTPSVYLVHFRFDADVPAAVHLFFNARQALKRLGDSLTGLVQSVDYQTAPEGRSSTKEFPQGNGQTYLQDPSHGLDLRNYTPAELAYRPESNLLPCVLVIEPLFPAAYPVPDDSRIQTWTVISNIACNARGRPVCQILRHEILVRGVIHFAQELYGASGYKNYVSHTSSVPDRCLSAGDTTEDDVPSSPQVSANGNECSICLTEACTTAPLPCKHICLCDDCGEKLWSDSNGDGRRCPICRSPMTWLLRMIGQPASLARGVSSEQDHETACNTTLSDETFENVSGKVGQCGLSTSHAENFYIGEGA